MAWLTAPDLPRPFDEAAARQGRAVWAAALARLDPALALAGERLAQDQRLLDALFGNSPYLAQSIAAEPGFLAGLVETSPDAAFAALLARTEAALATPLSTEALMAALRVFKRRAALLTALADITGAWGLEAVTGALTRTAELALTLAVRHVLRPEADDKARPEIGSGFIVLGMGKLGARELNFSSDIDLIVLYDETRAGPADRDRLGKRFVRATRELVRIMEERTTQGYVFRTDLRLRPDPSAMPVAVSLGAAEAYYASVGQNWERAAFIKARPVAGDIEAGEAALQLLRPWLWRRHLDFAAIRDIQSIKRQIARVKGGATVAVAGHDIKLGAGGIREIEFFAQTQQLIFGGRDETLRPRGTVAALGALAAAGRVSAADAASLAEAYAALRRVEHRLQMIDDRQTHTVPLKDEARARLALFLGYEDEPAFAADLRGWLERVVRIAGPLFAEAPLAAKGATEGNLVFTGVEDDPDTLATLAALGYREPAGVAALVRNWHRGRIRATRSERARELLTELMPTLLAAFARVAEPDRALGRFDAFLAALPAGVQLLSLLQANKALVALLARILGLGEGLADQLARHPALLDAVLMPGFLDTLPADPAALLSPARGDPQDDLPALRRFALEQRFHAAVQVLEGASDGERVGPFLAGVADAVLGRLKETIEPPLAGRRAAAPPVDVALLGMGRLGSAHLGFASDLDLIAVYRPTDPDDAEAGAFVAKLTQRLVAALQANDADGRLYQVDLRLRPSGNAGPVAASLDAFLAYQHQGAWTWEHMALTRARVVAGPADLAAAIEAGILAVLTAPRDKERLRADVADMRRRVAAEHRAASPWDVKHARGGRVDVEFVAQYLMLRHAAERPAVLRRGTDDALAALAAAGALGAGQAGTLRAMLSLCHRVDAWRSLALGGTAPGAAAPTQQASLARAAFPDQPVLDFAAAENRLAHRLAESYAVFQAIVDEAGDTG